MAATVKARARGLLKGARELLGEKALPKEVRTALETLESSLKRTWADLESEAAEAEPEHEETAPAKDATDAAETPVQEAGGPSTTPLAAASAQDAQGEGASGAGLAAPLREARNVGQWFEAEIHRNFTMIADGQFGEGQLTREERISLSSAIGDALDAFARKLSQAAPQLYERDPYQQTVQEAGPLTTAAASAQDAQGAHAGAPLQEDGTSPLRNIVPLVERALRADGTTKIKVIEAGWGTSGFYSPEVLKRDGPQAFRAGTHMFVDHPTVSDELERPERSLKELGGVLVSDARWEDDAAGGPGLYADAKVFSGFGAVLEEMAPHIGVSINADGVVREGAAEGRKGRIVERIRQAKSVDFVTQAGAGGKVMALYEARRLGGAVGAEAPTTNGGTVLEEAEVNEEELKALREAKAAADEQVARLQEALLLREARDVAAAELAKIEMPEPTRGRLLEAQAKRPVVKDGKLDTEAYAAQVREAATAELAYLVEATGAGRIVGMGGSSEAAASSEQVEQRLNEAFRELGLSDSLAERAAKGR